MSRAAGEKIKVLAVIRFPVGGIRTYLKYTYRYLDPAKYSVSFLSVQDPDGEVNWLRDDLPELKPSMTTVPARGAERALSAQVFKMLRSEKFDLIHSHGFTAGMLAALANVPFGVPHLVTSHDVFRPDQFEGWRGALKKASMEAIMKKLDAIQMVSHDAKANLLEYFPGLTGSDAKLHVIVNGIDVDCFHENGSAASGLREKLGVGRDQILFGYLGRFMPQKGFVELVGAVEELSHDAQTRDRFKIVAVNDGAYVREYRALIERKGLQPYFVFHGFVPRTAPVLRQIDALVMPSLWEACGLLAMEAMIVGTPVVASDCIGLREITERTPAIRVEAGDPHSLADGMRRFLKDPPALKSEAASFAAEAQRRFDSRDTARQLDRLMSQLISSQS